ncbi:hypothetical protein RsTz2092_08840 [Deferribacterales bacterium RsTz2092]|nr:hypothetical protein AGMMS49941_06190 [Deferribacterales bacterium]
MFITLNGEEHEITSGTTVESLLNEQNIKPAAVAIEHNGTILERGTYQNAVLNDGDTMEVIRFIGGG